MAIANFDGFYRETKDECFRALVAVTRDAHEAADLTDEAFTRAWERWREVSRHPAPKAWVLRTAFNLHRDRLRRLRRFARLSLSRTHEDPPPLPVDPRLLDALHSLPPRQRAVVALRVVSDLDTSTTADILGIAPGTVTAHLHRALSTLRVLLAPVQEDLS